MLIEHSLDGSVVGASSILKKYLEYFGILYLIPAVELVLNYVTCFSFRVARDRV